MSIFDKIGGTLVQSGTSLINNAISQHNAKEQRDWQEKMMDKANAYNSPLAQALRMRSAGLNPYQDMGAVPSASAGTGSTAQTIPLSDPLAGAFTLAQIRNMDAQTGKTETETEKYLREITNLELLYQKGLIEKEEMEFRLEELKKAWKEKSQYKADVEATEAGTEKAKAEAASATQDTALKEEQTTLAKKQQDLAELQSEYQRVLNDNLPEKIRLEKQESLARTAADYAAANAANANAQRTINQDSRESEQHDMNMAIDAIKGLGMLTENQAIELKQKVDTAWNEGVFGSDAKGHRWQNFETIVNDFFHTNLNLSGSAGVVYKK